jgi:hypothetical protein
MSPSAPTGQEKREFASEIKFLIDPAVAERVRAWVRERLVPDPNARGDTYCVTSLYFDTPDFSIFHRTGRFQHSKFRIRRYDSATLFLERKLKISGQVAKRRTLISPDEFNRLTQPVAGWSGGWFLEKAGARGLRPVCQVDYTRTARVLLTPTGPIRVTLDEGMRALPVQEMRFHDAAQGKLLTDRVILELKYRRELPFLFRELVTFFGLNPVPSSKYRSAVQTLGLVPTTKPAAISASTPILACRTS